jgi:hypothetical protein
LTNAHIAGLLAAESETARQPLQKAYRRASRRAFLWPEEAYELGLQPRPLTEFSGLGPFLEKRIQNWIDDPPRVPQVPPTRSGYMAMTEAQTALASKPNWVRFRLNSDMAEAALQRNYEYISIAGSFEGSQNR